MEQWLNALMDLPVTRQTLKETSLVKTLSAISKNTKNQVLALLAQKVRASWKSALMKEDSSSSKNPKLLKHTSLNSFDSSSYPQPSALEEDQEVVQLPDLQSSSRNRVLKMLYDTLKGVAGARNKAVAALAQEIEQELSQKAGQDYMKVARERVLLLRSKPLEHVKEQLVVGSMSAQEFVSKEASEFESKEVKEKKEAEREWAINSMQSDFYKKNLKMQDGEFQCFKCKSKKIFSFQKQMRSADEPMTTFCECSECGTKWKMN